MPAPETFERNQKAVLFAKTGDARNGEPRFAAPVEIDVRWEASFLTIFSTDSRSITYDATIVVDEQVPVDSVIWEGTLDDWNGTGSGDNESELLQIKRNRTFPDVKGREVLRVVDCMRFRGSLSTTG